MAPRNLASQLLAGNFSKTGPAVTQLSDPLVDTPMVITLDQLKPYELNPRIMRNPLYEDIKSSIRERGLDAPPTITRRPGDSHFIIRNGGNTRLSILKELWQETKEERFFKIHCLFKPWVSEIVALTGHLAESELHGTLTFIERALAVEKIREIFEQELGEPISQRELAKRLQHAGYPISQTSISQIQEAVTDLLPVIPTLLYAGMSRRQAIQILRLRKSAQETWDKKIVSASEKPNQEFEHAFNEILSRYDDLSKDFDFVNLLDQLTGYLAQIFNCNYDLIALELSEKDSRQRMIETPPSSNLEMNEETFLAKPKVQQQYDLNALNEAEILSIPKTKSESSISVTRTDASIPVSAHVHRSPDNHHKNDAADDIDKEQIQHFIDEHIVSPVETTSRLNAIQGMVSELTGDTEPNFKTNVLKSIPVQAGGLYAISDIWHIGVNLDNSESLRTHMSQLVLEIVEESEAGISIQTTDDGLGFVCNSMQSTDWTGQILIQFFQVLARQKPNCLPAAEELLPSFVCLLTGGFTQPATKRLSDVAFVKLMRVLRLMRRFNELNGSGQNNNHTLI